MDEIVVVPIGQTSPDMLAEAVGILNASQPAFRFRTQAESLQLPEAGLTLSGERGPAHSWESIFGVLADAKEKLQASQLVGVVDERIEKNLFAKGDRKQGLSIISTADWSAIAPDVPVVAFLANTLTHVVVWNRVESWQTHEETRGCIGDYCYVKADVLKGIASGEICEDCNEVLRRELGAEELKAVNSMLKAARDRAAVA